MSAEQMMAQVVALTDELTALRGEIIQMKTAHATLHQSTVDSNNQSHQAFGEQGERIARVEKSIENMAKTTAGMPTTTDGKPKFLIEPKQVEVEKFSGSMADSRGKFLSWAERIKDRVTLFDDNILAAMASAEKHQRPITDTDSRSMGMTAYGNQQLQGFLKDKTEGEAHSIVRGHKEGLALESWIIVYSI